MIMTVSKGRINRIEEKIRRIEGKDELWGGVCTMRSENEYLYKDKVYKNTEDVRKEIGMGENGVLVVLPERMDMLPLPPTK